MMSSSDNFPDAADAGGAMIPYEPMFATGSSVN
jgi:hypothetical protein